MDSDGGFGTQAKVLATRPRRVDWTRLLARQALLMAPPQAETAFGMVSDGAEAAMAAVPPDPDLRAWHGLASDLATALRKHDDQLSERSRLLAGRLRLFNERLARAPKERVALRPTSRRVLEAVMGIGGASCTLYSVRQHTGLSQTHLSNIVRTLAAYGFIAVQADDRDGRGRRLTMTALGKSTMTKAQTRREKVRPFHGHITTTSPKHDAYDALRVVQSRRPMVHA